MKLFLMAYVSAAIVMPAVWIGARLWLRRYSRTSAPGLVSAQIIPFPIVMGGLRCGCDPIGKRMGSGSRAVNEGACRKSTSTSRRGDDH